MIGEEELVKNMKLSVEGKVAAAVAAGFIAVTAAAIGQGGIEAQSSALNYGFSENPGVNTQIDTQAYSSLYDRSNVEVSREKFRDHDLTGASSNVQRAKQKSREHITREQTPQNQHPRPPARRY
jgi:hypothetical protein